MEKGAREPGITGQRNVQHDDPGQPGAQGTAELAPFGSLDKRGQCSALPGRELRAGRGVEGVHAFQRDRERRGVEQLQLVGQVLTAVGAEHDVRWRHHRPDDKGEGVVSVRRGCRTAGQRRDRCHLPPGRRRRTSGASGPGRADGQAHGQRRRKDADLERWWTHVNLPVPGTKRSAKETSGSDPTQQQSHRSASRHVVRDQISSR